MLSRKPTQETEKDLTALTYQGWLKSQVEGEAYWFHRIELAPDLITPGWSDPKS